MQAKRDLSEIDDFILELSSGDEDVQDYVNRHEEFVEHLDEMKAAIKQINIETIEDYKKAMQLKSILTSTFCYAHNTNLDKDTQKRASTLNDKLGEKILSFSKNHKKIKDSKLRSVAKYLTTCWNKYYRYHEKEKIVRYAIKNDILRKHIHEDGTKSYHVIGLHYQVGDNTFSINSDGSESRNYIKDCSLQAFPVRSMFYETIEKIDDKTGQIPPLPDYYNITSVMSDRKGAARIYLSQKDKKTIQNHFTKY